MAARRLRLADLALLLVALGAALAVAEAALREILDRMLALAARRRATGSLDVLRRHAPGLCWRRDGHSNAAGNRLFAVVLAELLEPVLRSARGRGEGA
jgi:hypothetical protein